MLYYLKKSIIGWVYTISMAFIAYGIMAWTSMSVVIKIFLAIANLAMYGLVVVFTGMRDGEEAMRILHDNDANRRRIIQTGADIPINRLKEYRAYKGFIVGLFVAAPMILLLIIHAIVYFTTGNVVVGGIAVLIYNGYSIFFGLFMSLAGGVNAFYLLAFIPVIMCFSGIPYIIGARKMQKMYESIKKQKDEIYGEQNWEL